MRIMSALHPTSNQKRVIAKILAAPTPMVAGSEISNDANIVAARNMLMKLGVITFTNGEAQLTDSGLKIASDENIADANGQLTSAGQKLAYTDTMGSEDQDIQQAPAPTMDAPPAAPFESVSILQHLIR